MIDTIRYPGQYYDDETGLHYNRFRYYDPSIGRYISADPVGQNGGPNVYAYVLNDPINWMDPFGLDRLLNPNPGGVGGGSFTFVNDVPGGPSTNLPLDEGLADMLESVAKETGFVININSTTGGNHGKTSLHPDGRAVDINAINGKPIDQSEPNSCPVADVATLQKSFSTQPNIWENFGPTRNEKTLRTFDPKTNTVGTRTVQKPDQAAGHRDHIHSSSQR